ncbi:Ecotropic viral integration site 5-like protein [Aphelenchoides fujianensis]|nr:Ecotropic viral integration site 5-like protein [Aphelenchoides fujianensis]
MAPVVAHKLEAEENTDCETYPPSDSEAADVHEAPEVADILSKMEQLNRANECDARSVASRKSGGSSSESAGRSGSVHPACEEDKNEVDIWTTWGNLVKSWESEMRKRPTCVKEFVRRGIPQHFRTIVWQLVTGANAASIHDQYTEYLRQSSPYEKVIMRDVGRTFPEMELFKDESHGQQNLFNVLKAYSVHDREVGYTQGSAFIVGMLLLQMPEEEAFAVFIKLMENYRMRELYKPSMAELGLCMFQLECLIQEQQPDLYAHFNNQGFDVSMFASSWFLTLFATTLSLELCNLTLNAKKMKKLEKDYLAKRTKEQEEAIELRRLRTENRLLRQRIDYLEHESSALADRLWTSRRRPDDCLNISHELHVLREINSDAHRRLEEAYETIRELSSGSKREGGAGSSTSTGTQVDDTSMIEHIHTLQRELIETHSRKADLENNVRELKSRIQEVESSNKRLRESPPDGEVASLQEELIRVKMREAEASLSLKEMRQRLAELEQHWQKYEQGRSSASLASVQSLPNCVEATNGASPNNNNSGSPPASADSASVPQTARKTLANFSQKLTASFMGGGGGEADGASTPSIRELEDQLMCLRIREADANVELREMRQKVMELETQNHVCSNQLKRQDDEMKRVKEELDELKKAEEKIASNRSADATSIDSEQMSAFLADVTLRPQNGQTHVNGSSLMDETDDEDSLSVDLPAAKSKTVKPLRRKQAENEGV